jgi:hypothetical protein
MCCSGYWQTFVPPHAVDEQTDPAQHWLPVAPQTTQRFVPVSHTNGSPQNAPVPRFGGQQGCPRPPQATHVPFEQVLDGAVQFTLPAQQGSPSLPHAPAWQPPSMHAPWVPEHMEPVATHWCVVASQQPPFRQALPSQQACPAPPQVRQPWPACGSHAVPDCVQKSLPLPAPFGLPGQHTSPSDPHVPIGPVHRLLVHVPSVPPHELLGVMQRPPTQQRPCPHALRAQQGCPAPPHVTIDPLTHAVAPFGPSPLARHVLLLQQPPPWHALPLQQG